MIHEIQKRNDIIDDYEHEVRELKKTNKALVEALLVADKFGHDLAAERLSNNHETYIQRLHYYQESIKLALAKTERAE